MADKLNTREKYHLRQHIRDYCIEYLSPKATNLKIWWSRSFYNGERYVLEISFHILNPTLRLVKDTPINCKDTYLVKINTVISVEQNDFLLWLRDNKLNKLIS